MKHSLFALLCVLLCLSVPLPAEADPDLVVASSYLGGPGDADGVVGSAFMSDGRLVIATNTGDDSSEVLLMSEDGREVLARKPLKTRVSDLVLDGKKRVYLATDQGVARLSADLSTGEELYRTEDWVKRLDVADNGVVAALVGGKKHAIHVLDDEGKLVRVIDGKASTEDVCIDRKSESIIFTGYRNARAFDGKKTYPVQICYLKSVGFDGKLRWSNYDWSTDREADDFLNGPENNMADTRGYRCTIGADGMLYVAFEAAGGNHLFRYLPRDINQKSNAIVADVDQYHQFHNSRSEHKTVLGRFDPASGDVKRILQFTARKNSGEANTVRVNKGEITADKDGRVYLVGQGFFGLPLSWIPEGTGDYTGGAFLLVVSPEMNQRMFLTRLTSGGDARTVAVDLSKPRRARVVIGGGPFDPEEHPLFLKNPIREKPEGEEGFVALFELK